MVSQTKRIREQQARQRELNRKVRIQAQQAAARKGVTIETYIQQQQVRQAKQEVEKKRKEQAKEIEKELKKVKTPAQADAIYSQIPSQLKKYVEITPQKIRQERQQRFEKTISELSKERDKLAEQRAKSPNWSPQGAPAYRLYELNIKISELNRLKKRDDITFEDAKSFAGKKARGLSLSRASSLGAYEVKQKLKTYQKKIKKGEISKISQIPFNLRQYFKVEKPTEFTSAEQKKIEAWSKEYQMSPTLETARKIASGEIKVDTSKLQTGGTYQNIFTGEKVSAYESPGGMWQEFKRDPVLDIIEGRKIDTSQVSADFSQIQDISKISQELPESLQLQTFKRDITPILSGLYEVPGEGGTIYTTQYGLGAGGTAKQERITTQKAIDLGYMPEPAPFKPEPF
ncbi:MAG: hypothetical protein ACP5D2_05030, partial [Candidatus Nanoarchaeia archaeon]